MLLGDAVRLLERRWSAAAFSTRLDHVAHAENAAGDALGWKSSSASHFSPTPTSLIGLPVTARMRERGAAAAVAVDARQHDAGDADPLIEALGKLDGVLAGERSRRRAGSRADARCALTSADSCISASSIWMRPAVSSSTTS